MAEDARIKITDIIEERVAIDLTAQFNACLLRSNPHCASWGLGPNTIQLLCTHATQCRPKVREHTFSYLEEVSIIGWTSTVGLVRSALDSWVGLDPYSYVSVQLK